VAELGGELGAGNMDAAELDTKLGASGTSKSYSRERQRERGLPTERQRGFFYIFIFSRFCKNIWSVTNLAKIYICRRGPRHQGLNAAAHSVRSHQEWAQRPNTKGHDVISLTLWPAALGA
jgi:hypothetical protein